MTSSETKLTKQPLLTDKQFKFADNLFNGMTQRQAYIEAGYSANKTLATIDECACRVANSRKILARIQHLHDLAALPGIMTVAERKKRLSDIARANLVDFTDDKGEPKLDKDTPHNVAARDYYHRRKIDKDGNEIITKNIKLTSPIEAISELNRMENIYNKPPEKGDTIINVIVNNDRSREMLERIGERTTGRLLPGKTVIDVDKVEENGENGEK